MDKYAGISDLDTGIDLSGISFIQSEINKTYGLKIRSSRWRWLLSVKGHTGFKRT